MYGPKVLDHSQNPRCFGKILDADGEATIKEACGDVFRFYVKVNDNRLVQVRHEAEGCPVAIACCSMTATLAEGKTLLDATEITNKDVTEALGGLPPEQEHCSNLAADALYEAIQDYMIRRSLEEKIAPARYPGNSWKNLYLPQEVQDNKGE
mgnify:FL=1